MATPFKMRKQYRVNLSLLSGPFVFFQEVAQNETKSETSFKTPHKVRKWNQRFFQDHGGWIPKVDSFQDPCKKSQKTQPQVYGPC